MKLPTVALPATISVAIKLLTFSLNCAVTVMGEVLVGLGAGELIVTVGGVRSSVYTWPVNVRLVTSCDKPASLVMFKPSVPSPVPVLTVTSHCVSGDAVTAERVVMEGAVRPVFARVKLLLVRPATGLAKVTRQTTEVAFVGLVEGVWRLIEETVVSGLSTGVMVGSLPPPTDVSSVSTFEKLIPLRVP